MPAEVIPPRLNDHELSHLNAYWRAANYLSVGQIYLQDNPLLDRPLTADDVKPRLLGHWGTCPGLNLVYAHANRILRRVDRTFLYIAGPGHGGPAMNANTWLEGTYGDHYPDLRRDRDGMRRLFRQFSYPGGVPSHVAPHTPGSLHEGGELGYCLSHAYGAVFDNPDLVAVCVIGDGEAETGPLAAAWHSGRFVHPRSDGAVLPVLHLNGYKIANPTILARIGREALVSLLRGYGYTPLWVEGSAPDEVHQQLAAAMTQALDAITAAQDRARGDDAPSQSPLWPMIVLKTPKGWTGPATVDGQRTEGSWRSHQVPLAAVRDNPEHLQQLERWLRSYRPEALFDEHGCPVHEVTALVPEAPRRMGACAHANGGALVRRLRLPDFGDYAVDVPEPGGVDAEATRVLGQMVRDVMQRNADSRNFRVFGPDETASNRLSAVFEVTARTWQLERHEDDTDLAADGRVMEILSEHTCQGWLEGYLLTGRHGIMSCYEAFIHIIDSMVNQHAKWLKMSAEVDWRLPLPSLNYLLTSHVWRQDHNGFSHQDPGFIDHVINKKADTVRVYLPADANTLLVVADRCLRSRHKINVIVAGKQRQPQWLNMRQAIAHCRAGASIWEWASCDAGARPDVVMACAGDVPTMETLAAVAVLRERLPSIRVRVVNVVDLMVLESRQAHPQGLSNADFDALFTTDSPVIFAFHGYPALIHRLTYRRTNHRNFHVHGFCEEGTTTTPFDMAVVNGIDRFHLAIDAIDRIEGLAQPAAHVRQWLRNRLVDHQQHIVAHGEDLPEIRQWRWPGRTPA